MRNCPTVIDIHKAFIDLVDTAKLSDEEDDLFWARVGEYHRDLVMLSISIDRLALQDILGRREAFKKASKDRI